MALTLFRRLPLLRCGKGRITAPNTKLWARTGRQEITLSAIPWLSGKLHELRFPGAWVLSEAPYSGPLFHVMSGLALFVQARKPLLINRPGFSQAVFDREGKLLRLSLSSDDKYRLWKPLSEIKPELLSATLLYEDKYFFFHPGFNPFSLLRAFFRTYLLQSFRTGGSTITMQVARMRFGINSKSLLGKLEQLLRALELEYFFSKKEILEAYLNLAPYGENIEGVGAASLVYFGKNSKDLTTLEALTLAVIPQNPAKRAPRKESQDLTLARKRLSKVWLTEHPDDSTLTAELKLPFTAQKRFDLPFEAPHFVERVLRANPDLREIRSTLDLDIQHLLEDKISAYLERNKKFGINNADALLIDYRSMDVKALIGSADFFNTGIQGQVDGTKARRSPGSALKPFLYGLAMEEGLIHPKSMLKDTPATYASYNPENFDKEFYGPVQATEALIRSRNLPAIELANKLTGDGFFGFLKRAGIGKLRDADFYGLSLVLGGVEVTMEELVKLYAMLANGGVMRELRLRPDALDGEGLALLSPEASYLLLEMLKHNPRPTADFGGLPEGRKTSVAWKTGTSYGFRDAWTLGVFGPYVLGIWIGNFNGEGNPAFVGRETAAYLFFDIADALGLKLSPAEALLPASSLNIKKVKVCSISGELPSPFCEHTEDSWFIPGKSPIQSCRVHREIAIEEVSGLRACDPNAKGPGIKREVYEFWPSDLLHLFRSAGIPRRLPPRFASACENASAQGLKPVIVSPQKGIDYTLRVDRVGQETIPLKAVSDADTVSLYWFADERLLAKAQPNESYFWTAVPGKYVIRVVDDLGRSDSRELEVKVVE